MKKQLLSSTLRLIQKNQNSENTLKTELASFPQADRTFWVVQTGLWGAWGTGLTALRLTVTVTPPHQLAHCSSASAGTQAEWGLEAVSEPRVSEKKMEMGEEKCRVYVGHRSTGDSVLQLLAVAGRP